MSNTRTRRFSKTLVRPIQTKIPIPKPKVEVSPTVSPSQGVPPPIDQRPSIKEAESSSDSYTDIELLSMKQATENLANQITEKIKEYKAVNQVHISRQGKVMSEVKEVHGEIDFMKESLGEILTETYKTKQELKEMREIVEAETLIDAEEESFEFEEPDPMNDEIKELVNAIQFMNQRLSVTEEHLKERDKENEILKGTINSLRASILEQKCVDHEKNTPSCGACQTF